MPPELSEKPSVAERVFGELRGQILTGHFVPGEALPGERALSKSFGVNRGAVREALKRLEQSGLVEIQHGEHTRVTDFRRSGGLDLLMDLAVLPDGRIDVEAIRGMLLLGLTARIAVIRLATLRGGDVAPALNAALDKLRGASGDPEASMGARIEFWEALFHGSGELGYRMLWNTLRRVAEPALALIGGLAAVTNGEVLVLGRIADVVAKSDPDAAERAVRELDPEYVEPILARLRVMLETGQRLMDPVPAGGAGL